jgi:outer membrane protein insertion porin family/translocation and assembly module TamA
VPPGKSSVASVTIEGTHDVDTDDLDDKIATRASPRFLGMFRGIVYEHETFDRHALRRDLLRIERWLVARGYHEAHVKVARVVENGDKVHVTLEVEQGPAVIVDATNIEGADGIEKDAQERVRERIASVLAIGAPLDEDKLAEAEKAAVHALTANGYAQAKVTRRAEVDLATHKALLFFSVEPGARAVFGPVKFEGLQELPESVVRKIFGIDEGDTYSSDDIDEGRKQLLDLGVFASVDVEADTTTPGIVPLVVRAEPGKLRAVLTGVGFQLDSLKTDVHATLGWQNSNFFGGLRKFEVRVKPGIVFYPTRFPALDAPTKILAEEKLTATLRQPAFVERRTTAVTRAEYNIFPVILPVATANVIGYHELHFTGALERTFGKLFVSPEYGFQANFPFDYVGRTTNVDTLLISYAEISTFLDLRDDPIKPTRGWYFGNELQGAGGLLGGDANDVRIMPEARAYLPLPKKVVLAARLAFGFLFPFNYAKLSQENFRNPGPSRAEPAAKDYQLLFFRGLFGGGPTSNRGYPLRAIGPHDNIPYLSPAGQTSVAGGCNPSDPACLLPTGGLSRWEASIELRFVVTGPVAAAFFCDAGDVSPFVLDIRPNRPHLSCGAGGRYDTPVGPIRLDVGYRIPYLQYPGGPPGGTVVGEREPELLFGAPIAIAFGIGEAF